jgi:PAS domain S-box-containing protein
MFNQILDLLLFFFLYNPAKHGALQHVPHNVAVLIADAKRREEKKNAKRVANRKSASTSRARKKALVQEMTEVNARLKRQALILSLLPDLVMVIDVHGVISFCSEQVERVLRHDSQDLLGSKITDLIVPKSRPKMEALIKELVEADENATGAVLSQLVAHGTTNLEDEQHQASEELVYYSLESKNTPAAKRIDSNESSHAQVGSGSEFPLRVVEVNSNLVTAALNENDNSVDSKDSKQLSSLTNSASATSSSVAATASCDSDFNGTSKAVLEESKKEPKILGKECNDDTSNTTGSSLSIDQDGANEVNKLQNANNNLERNVRWHNKKMKRLSGAGFKDDVIGAAVTANNASARLSSLRVTEKKEEPLSEEDSGYRESNASREDMSSSMSGTSESNGKSNSTAFVFLKFCPVLYIQLTIILCVCVFRSSEAIGPYLQCLPYSG